MLKRLRAAWKYFWDPNIPDIIIPSPHVHHPWSTKESQAALDELAKKAGREMADPKTKSRYMKVDPTSYRVDWKRAMKNIGTFKGVRRDDHGG